MIKKAVLLCGGLATRMLPITKSIPKEMLPLITSPAIDYCLQDLKENGITEVLIVLGRNKEVLETYFDKNIELEPARMTAQQKEDLLKEFHPDYKENEFEIPHWKITTIYPDTFDGWIGYDKRVGAGSESGSRPFKIGEVKPYLRPISSMTEDEKAFLDTTKEIEYTQTGLTGEGTLTLESYDYLNSIHVDYRGLIPMGLALEASKGMYKTK